MNYWINRLCEYWNDKKLADKCGMKVKDIYVHESDGNIYWDKERFPERNKCKKCGKFYR